MAFSIFSFTSRANPNLIARRVTLQQWRKSVMGTLVAPEFARTQGKNYIEPTTPNKATFTGAPIEIQRGFVKEGGTDMDIPIANVLVDKPILGDLPLIGRAERGFLAWRTVKINRTAKTQALPTGISEQILKRVGGAEQADNYVFNAEAALKDYLQRYNAGNLPLSLFAGYSYDLLNPTSLGGRNVTILSHPHFYTVGNGASSWSGGRPGTTAYEQQVSTDLGGLSGGKGMSYAFLRNLEVEAARLRIQPIVVNDGQPFYAIFISDAQWTQLLADTTFIEIYKRFSTQDWKNNPLVNHARAFVSQSAIFVDMTLPAAHTNTTDSTWVAANKVKYGVVPPAADVTAGYNAGNVWAYRDTGTLKLGALIGQNAMTIGVGKNMTMTEENRDHGRIKEIGFDMIQSIVRNDIFDRDGGAKDPDTGAVLNAGDFQENTSSLAFATYSPDAQSW